MRVLVFFCEFACVHFVSHSARATKTSLIITGEKSSELNGLAMFVLLFDRPKEDVRFKRLIDQLSNVDVFSF